MCTIVQQPAASAHWNDVVVVGGSGFGAIGTVTLTDTAGAPIAGGTVPTSGWSDTQVTIVLAPVVRPPDGTYRLRFTPTLGTPCTTNAIAISGAPACIVTSTPASAPPDTLLVLAGSGFGSGGAVTIGGTAVPVEGGWSDTLLRVRVPTLPPGTVNIVVSKAAGGSCSTSFQVLAAGSTVPCSFAITPNPADVGARILLTSATGAFGIERGTLTAGGIAVTPDVWTPAEIVMRLPASLSGNQPIVVTHGATTCNGTVTIQAGANALAGKIPSLSTREIEAALAFGTAALRKRLLATAQDTGAKWRYEYLRKQAIAAAERVQGFEGHVLSVMQMALTKVAAAEQLLNPVLMQAAQTLQQDSQALLDLANDTGVQAIIKDVANKASSALLLEAIILWLIERDPIAFWIGLFDRMIDDIASFDGSLPRTRRYLRDEFGLLGIPQLAAQLISTLDAQVDQFAAPLKSAVAQVVAGTSASMGEVFRSFDLPLTQTLAKNGGAHVPNLNPLATLQNQLTKIVDDLVDHLKREMHRLLSGLGLEDLFVDLMVVFVVGPVLAVFAVALAAGPFGAAVIAAIVMIAIEELLHLIANLLSGPLLGQVAKAKEAVLDAVGRLREVFGATSNLLLATSPAALLDILADELRQLRDFFPQEFQEAIASLIHAARDVVLRDAITLALGAEQALGLENATAFDAIRFRYQELLPVAPQVPGGSDRSLFAGAALIRDLGQLERQRTSLTDGKELSFVHRLSLAELLGDRAAFLEFLTSGSAILNLDERSLVDRKFPGVYRALIEDVRVLGMFDGAQLLPASMGIPLSITHIGESRTRVKRGANPHAPPLEMPSYLTNPDTTGAFYACILRGFTIFQTVRGELKPLMEEAIREWKRFNKMSPLLGTIDHDRFPLGISQPHAYVAWARYLPPLLGKHMRARFPDVDTRVVETTVKALLERFLALEPRMVEALEAWDRFVQGANKIRPPGSTLTILDVILLLPLYILAGQTFETPAPQTPGQTHYPFMTVLASPENLMTATIARLFDGAGFIGQNFGGTVEPTLDAAITGALRTAKANLDERISKWGDAELIVEPDAAISSLGYAILRRRQPAETAIFNLFASPSDTSDRTFVRAATGGNGPPLEAVGTLQYRPFENRGVEGALLVELSALAPDAGGATDDIVGSTLGDVSLPPLTDVIIEIAFRGCYDKNLAAAVKSSRNQLATTLQRLQGADPLVLEPGLVTLPGRSYGHTRTTHVSLRNHRQSSLDALLAAGQTTTAVPLLRDQVLAPLSAATQVTYDLRILNTHTIPVGTDPLDTLERTLRITLADLGVPANNLAGDLELLELAIALIPGRGGVTSVDNTVDPLASAVTITPIGTHLSGLTNLSNRRLKRLTSSAAGVLVSALDPAGEGFSIQVDFSRPELLWDAILSITYRSTATSIATSATNVR